MHKWMVVFAVLIAAGLTPPQARAWNERDCAKLYAEFPSPSRSVGQACGKFRGGQPGTNAEYAKYRKMAEARAAGGKRSHGASRKGKRTLAGCLRQPLPGVSPRDNERGCRYLRIQEGWD